MSCRALVYRLLNTLEFCINTYKRLDTIKGQLKARYQELEGDEPSREDLERLCFDFWQLTTFHLAAIRFEYGDQDADAEHAPYIPPEFIGERTERIQAMDARLQEVLGDAVEDEEDEDDNDDRLFDFQPGPDEQILLAEYGSIIVEHRWFVDQMNQVQLHAGDDGYVMNIIHLHSNGFDSLMMLLWDTLQARLRKAQ
jgi:hypothetical protein